MKKMIITIGINVFINLISLISLIILTYREHYKFVLIMLSLYVIGLNMAKNISDIINSEMADLKRQLYDLEIEANKTIEKYNKRGKK